MKRRRQQSLPLYGLAGATFSERLMEGEGADVRTLIHRRDAESGDLTVGVIRRTPTPYKGAAASKGNVQPESISAERAQESVAMALVVDLPGIGENVFKKAAELAQDKTMWKSQRFKVDGESLMGYEVVHKDMWVAYCLMPSIILYVLAPVALRMEMVELRTLSPNEVTLRRD